jgi:hypothetical protein
MESLKMRARPTRLAFAGSVAVLAVIVSGVAATSGLPSGNRCPADRDVMETVSYHGPYLAEPHEAVAMYVRDHGYELNAANLKRIADASKAATASSSSNEIIVDPELPDTLRTVDLVVVVRRTEAGSYEIVGGSFCARVVSGDD